MMQKRAGGETVPLYEITILIKGGERRITEIQGIRIQYDGEPASLIVLTDITERKVAEKKLQESEEKFRTLFENMAPGVFYQRSDGALIDANPAALSMFGLSREQFMGRDSYDPRWKVVSETGELLPPELHPSMIALRSGKPVKDLIVGVYNPERDEMTWLSTNAEPQFRNGEATPYQVFVTMYDITGRKVAEVALRKERDFTKNIIGTAQAIVLILDTEGHIVFINPFMEEISGYMLEEVKGKDWFATFLPSHKQECVRSLFQKAIGDIQTRGNVDAIITRDGRERLIEWYDKTIRDAEGSIEGLLAIGQDITERRLAEEAMQESEEKYRQLFELEADAILLVDKETGNLIEANRVAESLYGYSREEFLRMKNTELSAEPDETKHATQEALRHIPVRYHRKKDGTIFPVEITVNILHWQGRQVHLAAIRDITERKRAEDALQESKHFVSSILDSTPTLIYIYDLNEHRNVYTNREILDFLGYTSEQISSFGSALFENILHPEDAQAVARHHEQMKAAQDGEILDCEYRMKHADGTWRILHSRDIVFLRDLQGTVQQILGSAEDITERKKAEDTIRSALAEKEVLLREIHHRVKNNLAGIVSMIDLQLAHVTEPGHISLLQDLEARIRSMGLVHESLYLTKDLAQINFTEYTENLTRYLFQVYSTGSDIRYKIEMGDVTMPIGTAIPCGLVISEIVTNALKYAFPAARSCTAGQNEPPTITLTLQREGKTYRLIISDNGIGIPEGIDPTASRSLGLYLIRFIVKHQLRGTLELSTENGTAYTIRFSEPEAREQKDDG